MNDSTLRRIVNQAADVGELVLEDHEAIELDRFLEEHPNASVMIGAGRVAAIGSLPLYVITPNHVTPKG